MVLSCATGFFHGERYNSGMQPTSWPTQLRVVMVGYAVVLFISAFLIYERYMQYVRHPEDVAASSGMYAFGDWLLEIFIVCLFLIPTFVLVLFIRISEARYSAYSKVLLGISLTAPASVALFFIPAVSQGTSVLGYLGYVCLERVLASPLVVLWLAMSRLFARFDSSKRRISYALLIETLTLALLISLLFYSGKAHR